MGKRSIARLCILLMLLLVLTGIPVTAQDGLRESEKLIREILTAQMAKSEAESLQEYVDTVLTENAGTTAEWYVWGLCRYDDSLVFSDYAEALEGYLADRRVASASTRQKYALAFVASGRENTVFVKKTLADSIGAQGIMSYVYGLHLLNNGLTSDAHTTDNVLETILSLHLADGGWALSGDTSDADVTAMVLQALAPHYEKEAVRIACDEALTLLSEKQLSDGDFISYGIPSAESTAQVLMALCSLGIDPYTDGRFIKNGKTLMDGIIKYRLEDGSYCHNLGGESNYLATVQSFCAFVSLSLLEKGEGAFYRYEGVAFDPDSIPDPDDGISQDTDQPKTSSFPLWKILFLCGIGAVTASGTVWIVIRKKKKRDLVLLLGVGALLCLLTLFLQIESRDGHFDYDEPDEPAGNVTLSVRCDLVAGKDGLPADGQILPAKCYAIGEKDTVYDLLLRATKAEKILMEADGGITAYVYGIDGLYEYDHGDLSGWVYTVNGEQPGVSCGAYSLKDGDVVVFHYTLQLGKDIQGSEEEGVS